MLPCSHHGVLWGDLFYCTICHTVPLRHRPVHSKCNHLQVNSKRTGKVCDKPVNPPEKSGAKNIFSPPRSESEKSQGLVISQRQNLPLENGPSASLGGLPGVGSPLFLLPFGFLRGINLKDEGLCWLTESEVSVLHHSALLLWGPRGEV